MNTRRCVAAWAETAIKAAARLGADWPADSWVDAGLTACSQDRRSCSALPLLCLVLSGLSQQSEGWKGSATLFGGGWETSGFHI